MHHRPDQVYSRARSLPSTAHHHLRHTRQRHLSIPITTQLLTIPSLQPPPAQRRLTTSPCHHPQHLSLSQHLHFHNQLPTPQPKPLPHPAPRSNPPLPLTHNNQTPHTSIAHAPHYPDIEEAADQGNTDHQHLTTKDPLDDIQHHEDAAIDTTAADPHAVGLLTPDEGWILDQAYPAPEADGVPDEGPQAPPAALHPGRAHPPHQESGCSLLTFSANNCSA